MFQNNEYLLQLSFTQKFYQKTSWSVYDLIFIDTAMALIIESFAKTNKKLEKAKLNLQRPKEKFAAGGTLNKPTGTTSTVIKL